MPFILALHCYMIIMSVIWIWYFMTCVAVMSLLFYVTDMSSMSSISRLNSYFYVFFYIFALYCCDSSDVTEFESSFQFACPKFLSPVPPNYDAVLAPTYHKVVWFHAFTHCLQGLNTVIYIVIILYSYCNLNFSHLHQIFSLVKFPVVCPLSLI